jgi:hypothetical protein
MAQGNGNPQSHDYERKFADFIRLLAESKEQVVIVHHPNVLGDSYEELVEPEPSGGRGETAVDRAEKEAINEAFGEPH